MRSINGFFEFSAAGFSETRKTTESFVYLLGVSTVSWSLFKHGYRGSEPRRVGECRLMRGSIHCKIVYVCLWRHLCR